MNSSICKLCRSSISARVFALRTPPPSNLEGPNEGPCTATVAFYLARGQVLVLKFRILAYKSLVA